MISRLDRGWRFVGTAISFSSFGIGGLLLRLVYFPLLALLVRNPQKRTRRARLAIHHAFRLFVGLMRGLGVLTYETRGLEKLDRPGLLILSNHPSLIDVVFLISFVPNADCVVRSGLARNPFTRGPINATGYICNDSGAELIDDCIRSVKAGNNLVIFPEGTRTPLDGRMKLQRGAANIAVRGGCDITPVIIHCKPRSLSKGEAWWKIPSRRVEFTIEVLDDIPVAPFIEAAHQDAPLAARRLTDHLYEFFTAKRAPHAST